MMNAKRRDFLRTLAALPLAATTGVDSLASEQASADHRIGHKFKLSLNVYSFNSYLREGRIDLFDVLEFCAEHDFDAVDPTGYYFPGYPSVPTGEFINRFKRQAFLSGLDISGTGVRNDFANPDASAREADKTLIKAWIRIAAKLGSPNLRIFSGKNNHDGFSRDQVFEWMAQDILECCEYGRKYGVMIALQNHNDFIKTAADIERMIEMVDSEWLGLNLDIGSLRQGDPYAEVAASAKHAITWQIKEHVWYGEKQSATDFTKLCRIIRDSGYRGYLPIETLGAGDPYQKIPLLLENVRRGIAEANHKEARL